MNLPASTRFFFNLCSILRRSTNLYCELASCEAEGYYLFFPVCAYVLCFLGSLFCVLGTVTQRSIISFGYDDFVLVLESGDKDLFL